MRLSLWFNGSVIWIYFHIPVVMPWDSCIDLNSALPKLPSFGKRQHYWREITELSREIYSVFYLFDFIPPNSFSSFSPLCSKSLVNENAVSQLPAQTDVTNGERVSQTSISLLWPSSELICSSTLWVFHGRRDEEGVFLEKHDQLQTSTSTLFLMSTPAQSQPTH